MKLCFVGGGKMAEALLGGLISTNWAAPTEIGVIEVSDDRRQYLSETFPQVPLAQSCAQAASDPSFDIANVLVAVKPQHVVEVATELGAAGTERALSIAAGVTIATLQSGFGSQARVIRAMPNTPALVGKGAAAIAPSANATADDVSWASTILSSVGVVEALAESDLDAVTGLSGSGPAYLFLLAEAMSAAGRDQGLSAEVADALTRQTLLGAATLLASEPTSPEQLRANVTSPGGTTAAAIAVMQDQSLEQTVRDAIAAATARSRELGA